MAWCFQHWICSHGRVNHQGSNVRFLSVPVVEMISVEIWKRVCQMYQRMRRVTFKTVSKHDDLVIIGDMKQLWQKQLSKVMLELKEIKVDEDWVFQTWPLTYRSQCVMQEGSLIYYWNDYEYELSPTDLTLNTTKWTAGGDNTHLQR